MTDLMEQAVDATLFFGRFRLEEADKKLAALVTQAAAGDHDAFSSLMLKLEPKLRAVIKARSRGSLGSEEVDDVLQDVWTEVWEKGALKKLSSPAGVVPLLGAIARNKAINASMAKSRKGATHVSTSTIAPVSMGVLGTGRGGSALSQAERQIVRKAVTKALAKAKLSKDERYFVAMLFGMGSTPGGELRLPPYGQDVAFAKKAGHTGTDKALGIWASRVKRKFLQHFCTDKELCDMLPGGRGRSQITKIPGLGQNACKGVKGSCVEDAVVAFAHKIGVLAEDHPEIVEGEADELVLSWLAEAIAGA